MRTKSRFNSLIFFFIITTLTFVCSQKQEPVPEVKKNPPNFLWIVIDSLRGDIIGRYGVTPVIDEFAKSANVFSNHLVNAAWTRPSTLVFFTGKYASRNPVNFWDYPTPKNEAQDFYQKELYPLPKYLSQNGIYTVMVGNNPFLTDKNGLGVNVGFDESYDFSDRNNDTPFITKKSLSVLDDLVEKKKPFFIFLNYNDPHKPYTPPPGYVQRIKTDEFLEDRKRDYLGEVAYIDEQLELIFEKLKKKGIWDDTVVLITADHGEVMRSEHAISPFTGTNTFFGHGQDLFLENIHVPLLVKLKGQKQRNVIKQQTQSVDLYPFVLESFSLDAKTKLDGVSLQDYIKGKSSVNRFYYGETRSTQGIGLGDDFLLQKSFRFHELGKFWEGVVGREVFYYYNVKKDPFQIYPIQFTEISDLLSLQIAETLKNKIIFLLNHLREIEPKIPVYTLRFNRLKDKSLQLEARVAIDTGQIRLKSKVIDSRITIENSMRTLSIKVDTGKLKESESIEIPFEVYPDVTFPKFYFFKDNKEVSSDDVGIGMFELAPNVCTMSCNELFEAPLGKPKISILNHFQVWKTGGVTNSYMRDTQIQTDAMEILKKQGYVQ